MPAPPRTAPLPSTPASAALPAAERRAWRRLRSAPRVALVLLGLAACGEGSTPAPQQSPAPARPGAGMDAPSAGSAEAGAADTAGAGTAQPAPASGPPSSAPPVEEEPLVEERSGVTTGGAFVVSWKPVPDPIPFNEPFKLEVTVARAATPQTPEPGSRIEVDATMPAHGHGMNRTPRVSANGDGRFLVEGLLLHMSGRWNLIFHVHSGQDYGQAILCLDLP